jgi:2-dehydropantoate 2-reductase
VPIGVIRSHPRSRALLHDIMDEVVQVARAESVDLPADYAEQRMAFADGLPATMSASMHHDLQRGARLELPWLSGDVVARGLRLGVPTPCNRAIVDLLAVHADGAPAVALA